MSDVDIAGRIAGAAGAADVDVERAVGAVGLDVRADHRAADAAAAADRLRADAEGAVAAVAIVPVLVVETSPATAPLPPLPPTATLTVRRRFVAAGLAQLEVERHRLPAGAAAAAQRLSEDAVGIVAAGDDQRVVGDGDLVGDRAGAAGAADRQWRARPRPGR